MLALASGEPATASDAAHPGALIAEGSGARVMGLDGYPESGRHACMLDGEHVRTVYRVPDGRKRNDRVQRRRPGGIRFATFTRPTSAWSARRDGQAGGEDLVGGRSRRSDVHERRR